MSAILPKADITGVSGMSRLSELAACLKKQSRCSLGDRFVPHIVPRDDFSCEESWSEWQDLNLRPLVPNEVFAYPASSGDHGPVDSLITCDLFVVAMTIGMLAHDAARRAGCPSRRKTMYRRPFVTLIATQAGPALKRVATIWNNALKLLVQLGGVEPPTS